MRQFVHCNGCNSQVPTPESLDGKPIPQFLKCETCGNEFFWDGGLTDNSEPLILFSIEESWENLDASENVDDTSGLAIESNEEANSFGSEGDDSEQSDSETQTEDTFSEDTIENTDLEITDATDLATGIEPSKLEDFASEAPQPIEPEQMPLEHLVAPKDKVQVELNSSLQLEPSSIVMDAVPESLGLELESESEWDTQSSISAGPPTEFAIDHYEADQTAQRQVFEATPMVELAVPLDSSSAVDWSVLGPAIPRRRPKEVSAIRKILPPVLGGLAAFPIATLILWYGFGKDIGTTGPTVAKYVPWIVPEKFRRMPFESTPPNNANGRITDGRPQRSAPSTRNALPTINREEIHEPTKESSNASDPIIAMEKPNIAPENPPAPAQPKPSSVTETSVAKIPATVEALKSLLKEMENAPDDPKVKKGIFLACQEKLKELSQQSSELIGPAARTWSKQLEAISRKTLSDSVIPRVMIKIANRARDEFSASISGDFVATVIEVGKTNVPSANEKWVLHEKWASDTVEIPVEVLPGAWRAGSATLPATCMVFGRLLPKEVSDAGASNNASTDSSLVLKVHLLVPK